jgi:hypothetical protein
MNASRHVWMIYFVGFDDTADENDRVEPQVGRERIQLTSDEPQQMQAELELAAFLRGGQIMSVVGDDETEAEHARVAIELQVMRHR